MDAVVISGVGVVSPLANTPAALAARVAAADTAVGPLAEMPDVIGATVPDIPLEMIPADKRSRIGRLDRFCRLFLAAAYLAMDSAGFEVRDAEADRVGLSFGTGFGCVLTNAAFNRKLVEHGPAAASPRLFAYTVSSAAAGEVSIALGIKGVNVTGHMGFAAGLGAIGYGADLIALGKADVVVAGGADALGPALIHGLADMGLLKRRGDALPFRDVERGVYPSEGAAVVVLERRQHAQQRGAPVWGRIEGYAAGFEPTLTRRQRQATGLCAAMQRALAASRRTPGEIGLVVSSAHATALDAVERAALATVYREPAAPLLCAPKSAWGECFAAAGPLGLVLAAAWMREPPAHVAETVGLELDAQGVRTARDASARLRRARLAMVHDLCYSGPTVALVLAPEHE